MPLLTGPFWGSCRTLYKSSISSCRCAWAETNPAYLVTSGQSWEATTYKTACSDWLTEYQTPLAKKIIVKDLRTGSQVLNIFQLTAAIEGLLSSPGWGWVTSAPNMIVGLSVTRGIRLDNASTRTVFLPPTLQSEKRSRNMEQRCKLWRKAASGHTNLDIYLQCNVCINLLVQFEHLLRATALRNYSKIYFAHALQIT